SALEISVYLKNQVNISDVKHEIQNFEHVEEITVIPKAQSWDKLKTEMSLPNIDNPLPDTLHVKVDEPKSLQPLVDKIKAISAVEDTSYAKDLASKIELVNHVLKTITLIVICIMGLLTVTIINNTIQLVIQSRKDEIEIMRLMGVSNWYIRFPFIMQGAFYGFAGSVLALIPLNYIQNGLANVHKFFMIPAPPHAQNLVIAVMFTMSILFGAVGSFACIKKHLQV
ncbi:MAG: permease-like cell division protein FtsX, partial [Muribaculaceae bacterium]|nr:permease-like cell division protein FtsX [Muribaculaceae bacterium]